MFRTLFRSRKPRPASRTALPSLEELEVRNTPTTSAGMSLQALAGQTFTAVNTALSQAQQTQQAINTAFQFTLQGSPLAPLFNSVVAFDLQLDQAQALQAQQLFNTFSSTFASDLANGSLDAQDISAASAANASLSTSTSQALQLVQTNALTAALLLQVNVPTVVVNNSFNAFPGFFSPFFFPGFFPGFFGSGFLGGGFGGAVDVPAAPVFVGGPFFDATPSFDFTDFGMPADFVDFGGFSDFGGFDFGGGDFGGGDF
jgi:hypothetical protein